MAATGNGAREVRYKASKRQRTCRFIDDHACASSGSCGSEEIDEENVDGNGYARDGFIASSDSSLEL